MKLLRGCEKRIYYMKNTGSAMFEEAYFILKNDLGNSTKSQSLAEEADRIIGESCAVFSKKYKRKTKLGRVAVFSLGAAFASAVIGVITLFIGII